jgi:hypothetical protein
MENDAGPVNKMDGGKHVPYYPLGDMKVPEEQSENNPNHQL